MSSQSQIPKDIYPTLSVSHITHPNRLYAVPLLGFLIKLFFLIPVFIEFIFLCFADFCILTINSFIVLIKGEYWDVAYRFNLGIMRFCAKVVLFLLGLTDTYPGFTLLIDDSSITLDMKKPKHPNRIFALPIVGGVVRIVLLIPYLIYSNVLGNAAWLGAIIVSLKVLFIGKYPESVYELGRDSLRVSEGATAYLIGFSDKYPSFWISMNHQTVKLLLIIFSALFLLGNFSQ